jgi:hypothetical protein
MKFGGPSKEWTRVFSSRNEGLLYATEGAVYFPDASVQKISSCSAIIWQQKEPTPFLLGMARRWTAGE